MVIKDFNNQQNPEFYLSDYDLDISELTLNREDLEKSACKNFSLYGYCAHVLSKQCNKLHSVDVIIKIELLKKLKKNKKPKSENATSIASQDLTDIESNKTERENATDELNFDNQIHSAGLDAFMTGYVMLSFLNKFSKFKLKKKESLSVVTNLNNFSELESFQFNVYLTGKDYPLMVKQSNFASLSHNHLEKKKRILINKTKNSII